MDYVKDYLLSESLRIINADFEKESYINIDDKLKDQILNDLKIFIDELSIKLKDFLIENKILSPKDYNDNRAKIEKFIPQLLKEQTNNISKLISNSID